jgi:hypothetical protein
LEVQLRHVLSEVSATAELYLPCQHNVQAIVPVAFLNVPGAQALQFVPLGPV